MEQRNDIYKAVILAILLPLTAFATDRYVSTNGASVAPYTNWANAATQIRWAVSSCVNGDAVYISNGTYYLTNQITISSNISIQSVNGRDATFINGNWPIYTNRAFYTAITNLIIDGLTISNCCTGTEGNDIGGSAIYAGALTLKNSAIVGNLNMSTSQYYAANGMVRMVAGGIITNCIVSNNVSSNFCAGVYSSSGGQFLNSTFANNTARLNGGAFYCNIAGGGLTSSCCIFRNNRASTGSGMYLDTFRTYALIKNCLFVDNADAGSAGAITIANACSNLFIYNSTIVSNNAYGVYFGMVSNSAIINSIICSNKIADFYVSPASTGVALSNCLTRVTNIFLSSSGCITNSPNFVNFAGHDFHLSANSPAINSGVNQGWMTGATDLDDLMRVRDGIVDMGCYEYQPIVRFLVAGYITNNVFMCGGAP